MADRDYASGAPLPRDNVDLRGKEIGVPMPYGNQFEHNEAEGWDAPIGRNPNDGGASTVYPEWWTNEDDSAQDD